MKRENCWAPQGPRKYLQNWPQQPVTKRLCKNIQETRTQPPYVTGDILLKPCPYKMEMQRTQAGRQSHPPHITVDETDPGKSFGVNLGKKDVEKLERIRETAIKITGWEKNVL